MEGLLQYGQAAWQPGRTSTGPAEYPSNGLMSKTQASSPFKGGEPAVHHERAARALERLGILCYDVAKPMKECGCQETVFTNSLVGTKTGGRPMAIYFATDFFCSIFCFSASSFPFRFINSSARSSNSPD